MESGNVRISMLGELSISMGEAQLHDASNRSRKIWLLLAYLVYHRRRTVSQEELMGLLWGEGDDRDNPAGALKTALHRARAALNQLKPAAGHSLILRKSGGYIWSPEVQTTLDVEEFDSLCQSAAAAVEEDARLRTLLKALELYTGDFLPKLSSEPWVIPIATYYHNLYVETVLQALSLLESRGRFRESTELCRTALQIEPYHEPLYQHLMRDLLEMGDQKAAAQVYDEMSELLLSNFGVMPSEESRALYRKAVQSTLGQTIPAGMLRSMLQEESPSTGALICDYDFFKAIYQAKARAIERSGDIAHVALLTLSGEENKDLTRRSLDRAMENFQEQVRFNLRRGDVAAQCSISQFVLLLSGANYENSCMVCERIIKAFNRQYPHTPAKLQYSVQPIEPT